MPPLLFALKSDVFNRNVRKLNSILPASASAFFTRQLSNGIAVFDCRISQLPSVEYVVDYFLWRQMDAARNALNSWAYWTLRHDNISPNKATSLLNGQGEQFKNDLLMRYGINFNDVPLWQKRGIGFTFSSVVKDGYNPITKQVVKTNRRVLVANPELPMKDEYRQYIKDIVLGETL